MGLDLVELAIRFEDTFGITIPDRVAEELTTPRKVTDYIFSQVNTVNQSPCLSQQSFYYLRKKFVTLLGISRREFRPEVQLETLIPLGPRKEIWLKVMDEIGSSSLPALARPIWVVSSLGFLSILSLIVVNVLFAPALRWPRAFVPGRSVRGDSYRVWRSDRNSTVAAEF